MLSDEVIDKEVVNEALRLTMQDAAEITSIIVQSPCTKICLGAFSECSSLKDVKLPASIEWIGRDSFLQCSADVKVHFNDMTYEQVSSIPGFPFGTQHSNIIASDSYVAPETPLKIADDIHFVKFSDGGVYCNDALCCIFDFTEPASEEVDAALVD